MLRCCQNHQNSICTTANIKWYGVKLVVYPLYDKRLIGYHDLRGFKMISETNHKSKFEIIVKWFSINLICCMLILFVAALLFAWKFTPFIKIDDNGIEILNGAISIKDGEYSRKK